MWTRNYQTDHFFLVKKTLSISPALDGIVPTIGSPPRPGFGYHARLGDALHERRKISSPQVDLAIDPKPSNWLYSHRGIAQKQHLATDPFQISLTP